MSGPSPFEPPTSGTPGQPPGFGPPGQPPGQPPAQPEYGYQPPPSGQPPYGNTGWQQQAPPQQGWQQPQAYAPGQGHQPPKKKSKAPWIILGVVLAFLVLLIGGCAAIIFAVAGNEATREFVSELAIDFSDGVPAVEDATCEVDGLDVLDAYQVFTTVTNVSGEKSHYLIDYELFGPSGNSLGTDFGIVSNLDAGASERDSAQGVLSGETPAGDVRCEVFATTRVATDS